MNLNIYTTFPILNLRIESSLTDRLFSFVDFLDDEFNRSVENYDVFIIGVPEGRNSPGNIDCSLGPDEIRKSLYSLYTGSWTFSVLDLGNLKIGDKIQDTYVVLRDITAYLYSLKKFLIVLGGGHDLIVPIFQGYSILNKPLNFASVDSSLDFYDQGQEQNYCHSKSFLSHLISENSLLAQYAVIGYQTYLCSQKEIDVLNQMNFNMIRLGDLNEDIKEIEPTIRDLNHLSVDVCGLKSSEAPANPYINPNGVSSEYLCTILRYAGMSHSVNSILLSELNPFFDRQGLSAMVYAQSIWYFFDGFELRNDELLDFNKENFFLFHVNSNLADLLFYKSKVTNRWWVSFPSKINGEYFSYLSCSFLDYKNALDGILTNRLLKYLKL